MILGGNPSTVVEFTQDDLIEIHVGIAELAAVRKLAKATGKYDNAVDDYIFGTLGLLESIQTRILLSFDDQSKSDGA